MAPTAGVSCCKKKTAPFKNLRTTFRSGFSFFFSQDDQLERALTLTRIYGDRCPCGGCWEFTP